LVDLLLFWSCLSAIFAGLKVGEITANKTLKMFASVTRLTNNRLLFKTTSMAQRNFAAGPKRNLIKDMDAPKKESRMPYVFDRDQNKWIPSSWRETAPVNKLKFLTWNVWFDESQYDERVKHQFQIIKQTDPDVISLQEVLPLYLQKLANEDWVKQNYYISEFDGTQVRSYDTVLLSKFPAKQLNVYTIHSYMSRRLYVWDTELNNESATLSTVHLESLVKNTKIRKDQLTQIFTILKSSPNTFFFGDFNFCASVGEDQEFDPRFKDTWPALKGSEFQPTVGTNYPRAEVKPARYDRIYQSTASWVPVDVQLVGTNKIRQTVMKSIYPSDHVGVLGVFEWKQNANVIAAAAAAAAAPTPETSTSAATPTAPAGTATPATPPKN